jgi:hypothetical protein
MASINGVEVKNVKEIKNNSFEWGSILTGVIYLNGKKLGEWSQDPHGAVCDNFDAGVEKALMPAVLGVKSTKTGIEADIYDAISMETCVNKRLTIGAPGKEAMEQVIALEKKYLAENPSMTK